MPSSLLERVKERGLGDFDPRRRTSHQPITYRMEGGRNHAPSKLTFAPTDKIDQIRLANGHTMFDHVHLELSPCWRG